MHPPKMAVAISNATSILAPHMLTGAQKMSFQNWDEIRTAYQVARIGTVSGAAEVLGVHHATVIRHIDALEGRLGAKLFQRHARGYTPTEAGQELLKVAQATEDQFGQLAARINGAGSEMGGELVVTSVPGLSALVTPIVAGLMAEHPELIVRYVTDLRIFRLEYGEAHVAIRAGSAPAEPDNVVQRLHEHQVALFGSPSYLAKHGTPVKDTDLPAHRFIGNENPASRAPFHQWLSSVVPRARVVYRCNDGEATRDAVRAGLGLGFLPVASARGNPDFVEVMPPREAWASSLWLVTHVDLHRTTKVQAFLTAIKAASKDWPAMCSGAAPHA
ncbi:LysR family transcriptional regulator [Frigidibacter albus]|uniref:LysR family transcriptional regulator n=2 Tax=Frigidibacter mobilis TaxID=1335048 RepID=A0A165SGH1_9RHOB|nr:LysR family transcriptional regulator [Frigidibacter mobilis]